MLNIIDINTNSTNLKEVEALKESFRAQLLPTVSEGTVIIVSKFPAVGNMLSQIDYLVMFNIPKKDGNYLKVKIDNTNKYLYNAVLLVKCIKDDQIVSADDAAIYSPDGEFDYNEPLTQSIYDFRDYCLPKEDLWPFAIYRIESKSSEKFYNSSIVVNHDLTAKYMIWAIANQANHKAPAYGVNSFGKESETLSGPDNLIGFCRRLLDETNEKVKYGILTKKKIDQLARPSAVIDSILNNVGSSLSIIMGKAGTGKTLALTKVLNRYQLGGHNVRFLTYNNLLVFDIRQLLRNFPSSETKLSAMSIHSFFFKQSHTLGIPLLLSQQRVEELISICQTRIEKLEVSYLSMLKSTKKSLDVLLHLAEANGIPKSDFEEISFFAKFARGLGWKPYAETKEKYLGVKRAILQKNIGSQIFLQDYYKVLELLYLAVTDAAKFYEDMGIKDRYDLLSALYNTDKYFESAVAGTNTEEDEKTFTIPLENLLERVKKVEKQVSWSKLMVIDESQDFHFYEKEILFRLRRPENMIVASGGKEQLIRHNKLLDWSLSFNKKVSHMPFPLRNRSFRQKSNIVKFVNSFGLKYGIPLKLESVSESAGLGKITIDIRPKLGFISSEIATELRDNGKINGCSDYESLMFLVPSKGYTDKVTDENFKISDNDVVTTTNQTSGRKFKFKKELYEMDLLCWDGVSENKGSLKIPLQTETRVIHYESCRGLEAWSCALMGLDSYFEHKRRSDEAAKHLADDLFLSEEERRDKFAALWCLMAFTRPMDTLYIQLDNPASEFSKSVLELAVQGDGIGIKI